MPCVFFFEQINSLSLSFGALQMYELSEDIVLHVVCSKINANFNVPFLSQKKTENTKGYNCMRLNKTGFENGLS